MSETRISLKPARLLMATGLVAIGALLGAGGQSVAAAESKDASAPSLSVTQIIERHVAARGGLAAWRAVQTLSVRGQMEAGSGDSVARSTRLARDGAGARARSGAKAASPEKGAEPEQVELPFRLEMKRPHKSRVEVDFAGQTAVQVYDGQNGWKVRPFLNRSEVEPFTEQEARAEADRGDLEGPLLDYAAKGSRVALEGVEAVDGHSAYKVKLTTKGGEVQHVWIDAQSFLDVKVEGIPRRMDNKMRSVWIYQRDFRSVQGLMVPFLYETVTEGSPHGHKMKIDSVLVNRDMDDSRFVKPHPLLAGAPHLPAAQPAEDGKATGGK